MGKKSAALAIDTSTSLCSIAVKLNGGKVFQKNDFAHRDHLRVLHPLISELLSLANLNISQLNRVIVGLGPGSFTGLRIGVTAGNTIAQTLDIPVEGVSSLAGIAKSLKAKEENLIYCPVIDALRNEIYAAAYSYNNNLIEILSPDVYQPENLINELKKLEGEIFFTGDAIAKYSSFFREKLVNFRIAEKDFWYPKAASYFEMVEENPENKFIKPAFPLYLRVSDAESKVGIKWQRKN